MGENYGIDGGEVGVSEMKVLRFKISPVNENHIILLLFFCILASSYLAFNMKSPDKYTEFFVLGEDYKADNYPAELKLGEEATFAIGA